MDTTHTTAAVRRTSFDTVAAWTLTVTIFLAILFMIPMAQVPFIHTKTLILAIGALVTLVFFLLGRLRGGNVPVPHLPLLGALWLVPIAYLLSTLFSGVNLESAFFGIGFSSDTFGIVLILAVLATLGAVVLTTRDRQRIFLKGFALAFLLVLISEVIFIIAGRIFPSAIASTSNVIGTFVDVGAFVGLGIALSLLALRFLEIRGAHRTILSAAVIVGLIVLVLVNSFLTWILVSVIAFGLFVEAVTHAHRGSEEVKSHSIVLPLVTLAAGILFILGGSTIGNAIVNAFGTSYLDARPSWQSTFAIGTHTYAASPLFGSGPGSFSDEWQMHHDRAINDSIFWNLEFGSGVGHVPTSFVTTGVIGALAWIGFFALLLFFGARALLLRLPADRWARFVSVASFVGAVYVLILSIFGLPGPVTLAIGYVLLGLFIASGMEGEERMFAFSSNPRVGFAFVFCFTLLILGSIIAGYVIAVRYAADLVYNDASVALTKGDITAAESAINRSIALNPSDRVYSLASLVGLARMNQIAGDTSLAPEAAQEQFRNAVGNTVGAAIEATNRDPNNYQNWLMLGNIYASLVPLSIEGAYDEAKASYEKAVARAPMHPVLPFVLAQLELSNKNKAAAEEYLVQAVNLKRDYTNAILLLSRTEVESGKTAQALQAAEAAAYFSPNDQGVLLQVGLLRYAAGDTAAAIQALSRAVELNPQFANARFFLGVMYAVSGEYDKALTEIKTVASFSDENAAAVASDIDELSQGKNPFPTSRLAAFGIPYAPVDEPAPTGVTP